MSEKEPQEKKESLPEFHNDRVKFTIRYLPHSMVEYEVEASSALVRACHEKAVRVVAKQVEFPGFRKGRAPTEVVRKRFPREIDSKWQEAIASDAFQECSKVSPVSPLQSDTKVSFKMQNHSQDGAKLTLSFESLPRIPAVDPKLFSPTPIKRPVVDDAKVMETVRQAQLFFATWENIEDRPVATGDFVILDVEVIESDPPEQLFTDTRFEVKDSSMSQWMKELVLGQRVGVSVEGMSSPDEDLDFEEKKQFPPKKVRTTIKAIQRASYAPLDDAFAKSLGAENVDDLRERIHKMLNKQADDHVKSQERDQAINFLLTQQVDLPRSILEKETRFRFQQLFKDPEFTKSWGQMPDSERRKLVSEVMGHAERAVKLFYLCKRILSDAAIDVTGETIETPIDPLETLLRPNLNRQEEELRDLESKQAETYSKLLLDRAAGWLFAHAEKTVSAK